VGIINIMIIRLMNMEQAMVVIMPLIVTLLMVWVGVIILVVVLLSQVLEVIGNE